MTTTHEQQEPYTVSGEVYEAAVKGRQDFRNAYRELLPVLRAASPDAGINSARSRPRQCACLAASAPRGVTSIGAWSDGLYFKARRHAAAAHGIKHKTPAKARKCWTKTAEMLGFER